MPFVKLDCGIRRSSLWFEDSDTRVVFVTMLTMASPAGLVDATAPGIAAEAHLPLDVVRASLVKLQAPDPDSRTLANEGRRILRVDGGFFVVNYQQYRERDYTATDRKRRQRDREREDSSHRDNRDSHDESQGVTQAEVEAEVEAETPPRPPSRGEREPDVLDSGDVLVLVEQLAAEFIAAGGVADRSWRRRARGELRARGLEEGRQVVAGWIVAQRETRQQAGHDDAWAALRAEAMRWVAERGGPALVARGLVEWLQRNRLEGETDETAIERWSSEPGVPELVMLELRGVLARAG